MTNDSSSQTLSLRQPRRLSKALIGLFMKRATVARADPVDEGFRDITLASPEFKNVAWTAGQKVQIAFGSALLTRTYTPVEWDRKNGQTRILGFAHGTGPGSDWVRNVQPGDECHVFGPRASLDMEKLSGSVMLFGDETSFGLAHAAVRQGSANSVQCLFEVNDSKVARVALGALDVHSAELFERQLRDDHLVEVESRLTAFASTSGTFVLTGKAASIQRLRRLLKTLAIPGARIMTKAYWATGKAGLD